MDLFSLLGLRTHWVFLAVFTPSLYICKLLLFIIKEELIYFQPAWLKESSGLKEGIDYQWPQRSLPAPGQRGPGHAACT